ncbi:hypothetical protein ILUMI_17648 [Ignelater luminosus]|uniref:Uncharacterized protein n=1 Tax=Ignelater luminosus TaxID=2038154 RepID=A0A8K0G1N8_IGNLU|nr:hypothetical protein ILUMI_17648 [Ignelater luminosus]
MLQLCGHRAWECKKPKREESLCYEYGGLDHRLAQCLKARRQQDRQESQSATTLLMHSPDAEIPPPNITLVAQHMPTSLFRGVNSKQYQSSQNGNELRKQNESLH